MLRSRASCSHALAASCCAAARRDGGDARGGAPCAARGDVPARAASRPRRDLPRRVLTARVTVDGVTPRLVVRRGGAVVLRADLGRLRAPARRARVSATASRFSGTYATVTGKRRAHTVDATRAVLRFAAGERLELAVADDGVAFQLSGFASQAVRYRPAAGARGWLQRLTKSYEREYEPRAPALRAREIAYPALLADRRDTYTLLTETGRPATGSPASTSRATARTLVTAPAEGTLALDRGLARRDHRLAGRRRRLRPGRRLRRAVADRRHARGSARARRLVVVGGLVEPAPSTTSATTWTSPRAWASSTSWSTPAGTRAGSRSWWPTPPSAACACCCGPTGARWPPRPSAPRPSTSGRPGASPGVKADFLHSDSGERMAVIDDIAADAAAATCWSASTAARCRAACSARGRT